MTTPLQILGMAPWLSVNELAAFCYVNRTTISRGMLPQWRENGLVAVRNDGRLVRPRDRMLLSTGGLLEVYSPRHDHSEPGNVHWHDPLDPGENDHVHPHYYNGHNGAELLYSRLEMMEIAYSLAPVALMGEGAEWTEDGRPRRLTEWRWLRHARFVNAVATYEDNYKLFYCWVGRSVTPPMLRWRYGNRFERHRNLVTQSEGEWLERQRDALIDSPDPNLDFNPQVSGTVIVTPDKRGAEVAMEVLPRGGYLRTPAYLYAIGPEGGPRIYTGRAYPAPHDDVADRFEDIEVGIPQDLCR